MSARRTGLVIAGALLAAGLLLAPTPSYAVSGYLTTLRGTYPLVPSTRPAGCAYCHTDGSNPSVDNTNPFANAFAAAGNTVTQALKDADSDGDGFSNNTELTANPPSNAGDPTSTPPTSSTTTTTTTTTTAPTTTTTAATTSTTRPTTTSTAPTTTTTAATTSTTRPTTTSTRATTSTTRPTTTTTRRTTTTTTRRTTTTTAATTTTTLPSLGASLYNSYCADCHDGAALGGGGRNVVGARTCSIDGAIDGTSVFPGGVPSMRFLQRLLSDADIQAISDSLNSNPVTGQQRYITACAGCHGIDGRGGRVGEGVKGKNAGDILEAIREDEESSMGFLGCLPASDIKDIGNYLRGNSRGGSRGDRSGRDR